MRKGEFPTNFNSIKKNLQIPLDTQNYKLFGEEMDRKCRGGKNKTFYELEMRDGYQRKSTVK